MTYLRRSVGTTFGFVLMITSSGAWAENKLDAAVGNCIDSQLATGRHFVADAAGNLNVRATGMRVIVACEAANTAWINDCERRTNDPGKCTQTSLRIAQELSLDAWKNRSRLDRWGNRSNNGDLPPAPSQSRDSCAATIRTHGFMTRAQFQCGFRDYSTAMLKAAKDCAATMPPNESSALLKHGFENFDENERALGRTAICERLRKTAGHVVR